MIHKLTPGGIAFSIFLLSISIQTLAQSSQAPLFWKMNGNNASGNDYIGTNTSSPLIFKTDQSERFRITPEGNVGIGTSSPAEKLEVVGNTKVSGTLFTNDLDVSGTTRFTSIHVLDRIRIGQSIIIEGLNSPGNPYNHIYTDASAPTELRIQCQPSPSDYYTLINASNNGRVGIGTFTPEVKLHYHDHRIVTNNPIDPAARHANCCVADNFALRFDSNGDPLPAGGPVPSITSYGQTDFLITNSTTGNMLTDGLLIGTAGNDGYIRLQETGHLAINSGNGMTVFTSNGNMSLRTNGGNTLVQGNNLIFRTNTGTKILVTSAGNVGIGTTTPQYKLSVNGDAHVQDKLKIGNSIWISGAPQPGGNNEIYTDDADLLINSNAAYNHNTVLNANTGYVKVGILKPTGNYTNFKLSVDGKIVAREIYVQTGYWADFVFANDYKLRPLSEVEEFIAKHKHLPGVPSEKEILENGNDLANTDAILLMKIEELTLYLIALDKENTELKKQVEELNNNKD